MMAQNGRGTPANKGSAANMTLVRVAAIGACAVGLSVVLSTWAQEPTPRNPREDKAAVLPNGGVISPKENDQRIARWLNIDNRMIIECAQFAKTKAASAEVKEFAAKLAAEHEKCRAELADMLNAPAEPRKATFTDTTPDRRRTAVVVQDDGASRGGALVFRPTDFLAVKEAVATHLGQVAQKEWGTVTGAEFDRAFMKHVVMSHECLMANIKEVRGSASAEMRTALDGHAEKLKHHCQAAKALCESVCKGNPDGTKDK